MKESQSANVQSLLRSIALSLCLITRLSAQGGPPDGGGKADLETRTGRPAAVSSAPPHAPEEGLIIDINGDPDSRGAGCSPGQWDIERPVGPHPWVTILCRFADSTTSTPETRSWFETLIMGNQVPSMDHYYRELSYDIMNLGGSVVVGWYNLPQPMDFYRVDTDGDGVLDTLNIDLAIPAAMAVADPDVCFPEFMGINIMFNVEYGCCPAAIGPPNRPIIDIDGHVQAYSVAWFPPWGYHDQTVVGMEMFHGFGVPHSSGPYDEIYDSQWDVMSLGGNCSHPDAEYGCVAVHTISYHKDKLGWIAGARRYDTGFSGAAIITIEQLAFPPLAQGTYLMGKLRMGGSATRFYTVEVRRLTGYDAEGSIPGETVLIHDVDTNRPDRWAQVVDVDGDGDCNDDGAMWEPGEVFVDVANRIVVSVESVDSVSAMVSVSNKARDPVYVWGGASGYEDGSPEDPWNTVEEGYASVYPNGTVYIFPGNYPETLTMSKPCRLEQGYGTEPVIIGE